MPSCVFRKCKNYGAKINKSCEVTYHKFPSDDLILSKWASIVRAERSEPDWMPSKCSTICSAHFKEEDKYMTPKGLKRLKKIAVPVIAQDSEYVPEFRLDQVNISDLDSVLDTPRIARLKKTVRKLAVDKKKLQKINHVLKIQNKRLKKKVTSMKSILKDLKKNNKRAPNALAYCNIQCLFCGESTNSSMILSCTSSATHSN